MSSLGGLPALDVKPVATPPNPLEEFARVAQIKSQMQSQQLQSQELQLRQQQINDQQATTKAMQGWDPSSGDYDALAKSVLQNGGSANAATAIQQHGIQVKQQMQGLAKGDLEAFESKKKAVGDLFSEHTDIPDDQLQGWALNQVNNAVNNKLIDPAHAAQLQQKVQQTSDPTQLHASIDQFVKGNLGAAAVAAQQKTASETAQNNAKAANENAQAGLNQIKLNLAKNATPGSYDADIDKIYDPNSTATGGQNRMLKGLINSALQRGDIDSAKKYVDQALENQQSIAKELNPDVQKNKIATATAEGAARLQQQAALLNPAAAQMAAQMYAQTGQLPAGMRSPGMSAGILNTAAGSNPSVVPNIAGNKAAYQANTQSLDSLQKNFDQVTAFENTAGKNLDLFLKTAKPVLDSGSPWINRPLRAVDSGALGSADLAAFNTARQTAVTEIAKVLNSSNASGVLSDSARHEVEGLIGPSATLKQIYSAANILRQDMANRHQAYQQQIGEIRGRISGQPGQQGGPSGTTPTGGDFFSQFGGRNSLNGNSPYFFS